MRHIVQLMKSISPLYNERETPNNIVFQSNYKNRMHSKTEKLNKLNTPAHVTGKHLE